MDENFEKNDVKDTVEEKIGSRADELPNTVGCRGEGGKHSIDEF